MPGMRNNPADKKNRFKLNHAHNVALHFMHYNYCWVHQAPRVTPAMQAGLSKHVWEIEDLAALVEAEELRAIDNGELKREASGVDGGITCANANESCRNRCHRWRERF
jgi:hypothetical protein